MAAGEGRRLRPITERWPKPILPIDGRPVIGTLLGQLADAGVAPVTVVTGYLAEQVEGLLEGRDLRFARQPRPDGSADAVQSALAAGAALPALVCAADTVFRPGDLASFVDAASGAAGAIAYHREPLGRKIAVDNGLVREVVSRDPAMPYSSAPLWCLTREVALDGLPGPPFELAAAFQRSIDAGIPIAAVEIGPTRDLTEPADLVLENFPYLGD